MGVCPCFREGEKIYEKEEVMGRTYDTWFFDLDGTITDSSLGITNAVIYALDRFGIEERDRTKLYKFIGPPLNISFQEYYGFSEEETRKAVAYFREYYEEKGFLENQVYDGMEEVLIRLKDRGKRLVVATSKPEAYARKIIGHFRLSSYFDYIAGMELDGGRGSKAEVIAYALHACGIADPSGVLMVGDREHDVLGAASVGMDCLGVLYGFGTREELESAGAAYIAETVEDILKIS